MDSEETNLVIDIEADMELNKVYIRKPQGASLLDVPKNV